MRSQACTIQQALTPEAGAIVKQAVGLAKRRGHAQVTPLHVAHTMLSASSGLFRSACLQAHSHPLQCRALELCFNVALNRLPTSTSGPMLGPYSSQSHHYPTLANALVAAFKRAQAHQRRGSIENQQQPLLAVKIELDQLIISILDDPSVSRVMREAGFSSTLVKGKVEQAVSVELASQNSNTNNSNYININDNNISMKVKDSGGNDEKSCDNVLSMAQPGLVKFMEKPKLLLSNQTQVRVRNEDVLRVIESLVMERRNRNSVVVGECMVTLESLVKEVMERVEKRDVPDVLKDVKFVNLSFSSFSHFSREEVELRVEELKSLVKSWCLGNDNKGLILYLNDLKWANGLKVRSSSNHSNILVDRNQAIRIGYYCPIEHMIMEIGKLVLGYGECRKLWLLGIANFQTYMRCKSCHPSLESLWGLHAITIPADSLGLSLILNNSDVQSPMTNKKTEINRNGWLMLDGGRGGDKSDDTRSRQSTPCNSDTSNTILPSWLQQYKDDNTKRTCNVDNDQEFEPDKGLCKRWSTICTSSMQSSQTKTSSPSFQKSLSFSPSSSTSNFSYNPMKLHHAQYSFKPGNIFVHEQSKKSYETTLTMSIQKRNDDDHPDQSHTNMFISSDPNSTQTSTSSGDINEPIDHSNFADKMFKEYNADNLRALCNALEQKAPRQKDIIFDIASTILHCRSGTFRRKVNSHLRTDEQGEVKEDTWLFFQGFDAEAKESIAREIARLIFGSQDKFVSIGLSNFSSTTRVDSLEDSRNKRPRDEHSCAYIDRFIEAISRDCHRVFFVEDVDQVDYCSQMGIKKAMESGKILNYSSGEEICFGDAIIILSCESYSSNSRACSPATKQKMGAFSQDEDQMIMKSGSKETNAPSPSVSLDLNISINDEDNNGVESRSVDEIGLLASVDRCIVFKSCREES